MSRSPVDGGIKCPNCGERSRHVIESRRTRNAVCRRCVCRQCGHRFTTRECVDGPVHGSHVLALTQLLEQLARAEDQLAILRNAIEDQLPL